MGAEQVELEFIAFLERLSWLPRAEEQLTNEVGFEDSGWDKFLLRLSLDSPACKAPGVGTDVHYGIAGVLRGNAGGRRRYIEEIREITALNQITKNAEAVEVPSDITWNFKTAGTFEFDGWPLDL